MSEGLRHAACGEIERRVESEGVAVGNDGLDSTHALAALKRRIAVFGGTSIWPNGSAKPLIVNNRERAEDLVAILSGAPPAARAILIR